MSTRSNLAKMWSRFWKEINTPSDFRADPYGELTNQCAHTFLGIVLACVFCLVTLSWHGEFPHKETAGIIVTLPYILGELFEQRWRGWDTITDVFFYAVGGYGVLASLSETMIGDRIYLEANPESFGLSFLAFCIVLFVRVRVRVKQKYG